MWVSLVVKTEKGGFYEKNNKSIGIFSRYTNVSDYGGMRYSDLTRCRR